MKPNELMIGSIVCVKGDCEHKPFTVVGIMKDYGTWFAYLDEADAWYELRYIEPHPLYPEILDANGFKPTEANGERLLHQDNYEVGIDTKGARHWINVRIPNDDGTVSFNLYVMAENMTATSHFNIKVEALSSTDAVIAERLFEDVEIKDKIGRAHV